MDLTKEEFIKYLAKRIDHLFSLELDFNSLYGVNTLLVWRINVIKCTLAIEMFIFSLLRYFEALCSILVISFQNKVRRFVFASFYLICKLNQFHSILRMLATNV